MDTVQRFLRSEYHLATSAHRMHRSWRGGRFGLYAAHSARHGDNLLERTVPGWASFRLTNITSQVVGTGTGCPADHPVEVNVSGTISATDPGTKQYDGSPVRATICSNATDFLLKPGTFFTILKK